MAWTTPLTAVSNAVLTAAQWNASVRDNFNVTPAALATTAGRHFIATGANAIAERANITNTVATAENTATTTYGNNLGTTGPAITMTTGTNAIIALSAQTSNSTSSAFSCMGCAVSGASTVAAADADALMFQMPSGTAGVRCSTVIMYNTLTGGSNTFTAQYRASAGSASFANRKIVGIAL